MKITSIENTIVSVPYTHRETSTRVRQDGVTAVLVKISTDCGLVGWGESCPGPNVESICAALDSVAPLFVGRDPWQREAIARDFFSTAHWQCPSRDEWKLRLCRYRHGPVRFVW